MLEKVRLLARLLWNVNTLKDKGNAANRPIQNISCDLASYRDYV